MTNDVGNRMDDDDEDAGPLKKDDPNYINTVKPAIAFYLKALQRHSCMWILIAIVFALFYAVGTAGLGVVIKFLSTPDIAGKPVPTTVWVMLAAFCTRPIFYVLHIQSVAKSVLALEELPAYSRGVGLMFRSLIILTRDLPTLIIVVAAIIFIGKLLGGIIALLLLIGLVFVIPARAKAEKGNIARKTEKIGNRTNTIQRRVARTWAEASTDVAVVLLLLFVFLFFVYSDTANFETLASVVILGLLMLTPLRRMARLLVEYK